MIRKTFRAMLVTETEDKRFERAIVERSTDDLPEGDVLIRVRYSSLNYKDALSAVGNRGVTRNYPHTPGIDAAGVVEESSDDRFKPGDAVIVTGYDLGMNTSGGFGEYIRVPADWIVRLPENLTFRESMVYGTAGFTACLSVYNLTEGRVKPNDGEVLVTGAPGGVGSIAVSVLTKMGCETVALNGLDDESEYLRSLGAVRVIDSTEGVDKSGKMLLKPLWAGVIDTLGGDVLATALKSVKYRGTVTCCGNVVSGDLSTSVYPFILRGVSLLGVDSVYCPTGLRQEIWRRIANEWKVDLLDSIANEIGLDELSQRIDLILQGKDRGRTVVRVSG